MPYIPPREYKISYSSKMNESLLKRLDILWNQLVPPVVVKKESKKNTEKIEKD